uniref:Medium-chain acyl-CoA ligase ACSF2, mitochondrial n=1 Tax=Gasterosteus aculeatus TaxID=69293 RepID=G3P9K5_GASAC
LDASAQRWPDREAVVFRQDGVRKTFAQFQQDVDRAAAGLLALGLQRGDRLGVWGPNTYEWILFQFATAKAGIIQVSLNPAYQVKEVEFTLKQVGACSIRHSLIHTTTSAILRTWGMSKQHSSNMHFKELLIYFANIRYFHLRAQYSLWRIKYKSTNPTINGFPRSSNPSTRQTLSCDDPINIQFTSGTTGSPKGACLSHHNIVNNAYFMGLRMRYGSRPRVRVCVPVPLYHCFGSVLAGMNMAVHGITLVFPSTAYNSQANLEAIESEKCNVVYGTPTMFTDMLIQQDLHRHDMSSIEAGVMSGSPCPPEIVRKLQTHMNMAEITIGYGTTENSPLTFLGFPQDKEELKTNTVGCIMSHTEAKVVDPDTGEIVPVGASGELMIRGSCVMHGYWDNPEKTREVISQDRWYRTGDTASLDSLGYCRIEGRMKDLIIRGGENIYPAEVEQFLFTHPKVQEVQVVGVKDERLGEQVCACIRLRKDQTSSAEEIRAFCKGQISHFKIPHYVIFVDSYPLTVSGKIKKNILKEEMEQKKEQCRAG